MIEFTIKTLDSNNHSFSVDDETTVQQLKEKVMEQMGIEIHQQRLIFCGRVLQDERKLSEYDVHGKVVHLVQRAPPSTETRGDRAAPTPSSSTSSTEPNNMQQQIRRLMALGAPPDFLLEQQQAMALPPTTARLEFIRRMIADIKTSLAILREHVDGQDSSSASRDAPVEPTENEPTTTATPREGDPLLDENGDEAPDPSNPSTNRAQYARRSYRAVRALRQRHSNRPRDLGQLLEELEGLQEQFSPYRITYIRMLRCANNPEPPQFTGEGRQNAQRTVDIVSDIMHSFAHAYHAVSDLNFQVGQRNPRLTSESTFIRHAMPMQAHVNLVQPNRRPAQQQQAQQPSSNGYAGNVSGSGASSAQTASGTQAAPHTVPSTVTSNNQDGLPDLSGRISVQPTINFSIEPDPITYQVEIETRVPIAIPLENSLFDGLSAALSQNQDQNLQGPQTQVGPEINQAGSANQAGQDGQPGLNNQASQTGQPGEGGQTGQAGQANRRQVLLDFENILRGLGPTGGLGGVEVLMSMEELPHGSALGVGTIYTGNNNAAAPAGTVGGVTTGSASDTATVSGPAAGSGGNNSGQPMMSEEGMYVPLPWGPPSADLLQNIFQAMVRHGLPEGVTVQFPGGHAHHFHHIPGDTVTVTPLQQFLQAQHAQLQQMIQTPHNPQGAQQQVSYNLQGAQQQAPQGQPQNTQAQQPAQGAQANQDQWNSNIRNAQPHVHLRRVATATRAQAVPLSNCIYDRFLYCDSAHARRRLQRRREQHQQHIAAQERLRAVRTAAQNIETLRERNINLTENNIQTMLQLLNSTPSQESWLNAIFVTVARQLYLSDPMQTFSGEPQLLPNEYAQLRTLLRSLMHSLMDRSELPDAENTYEAVSEYFVTRHADFINNMHRITPVRYEVDIYPTLRGFIRARLPAIIACIMSDVSGEMFSGRFYSVIARMFTDFCTLIRHCLEEGVEGLRVIFRLFMEVLVRNFDEPVRQLLVTLGQANLNGAINNMGNNVVQQYIVRRVETIPLPPGQPQAPIPMEVSLAPQAREEPMQTSRPTTPAENGLNSQSASPIPIAMDTMSLTSQASTSTVTSQASTSTMTSAPTTPVDTVASTHSSSPSPSSPSGANAITDKDNNTSTSTPTHNGDTDENLRLVPPLVIVEHWDEEWVPVFTHDQQAQRAEPQEPCSEAYLSGMPSRKRRRVRQMRPPTSLDGFMNESVREAADHERLNAVVDHSAVRRALREHMRSIARTRASNSEDYDPQHFASVARFLNPTRPNIPQPQDNDTPNKDEE